MGPGRALPEFFSRVVSSFFGALATPLSFGLFSRLKENIVGLVGDDVENIGVICPNKLEDVPQFVLREEPLLRESPGLRVNIV